jgi:hypothetical protein
MKHSLIAVLLGMSLTLVIVGSGAPASSQDCSANPKACVGQRGYSYGLQITGVRPIGAAIVEHEAVEVSYQFLISTYGLIGDLPPLRSVRVCPQEQVPELTTCVTVANPRLRQKYSGKVQALAPVAGRRSPITLVVEEAPAPPPAEDYGWHAVDSDDEYISVAARYEIGIESFETLHTRSATTDTVRINLQSLVKSDPPHRSDRDDACGLEGFRWCVMNVPYGDVKDGLHQVSNVRVGPYLLTPEVEQELRVLYTVYNFGDSYAQKLGEEIANGFSKAGMIILMGTATVGSGAAGSLDKAMTDLHAAAFAGCDGLMAVDARTLVNQTIADNPTVTLDLRTRETGEYHPGSSQIYEGGEYQDGNTRCGAGGKYRVTYVVYRTSWKKPR